MRNHTTLCKQVEEGKMRPAAFVQAIYGEKPTSPQIVAASAFYITDNPRTKPKLSRREFVTDAHKALGIEFDLVLIKKVIDFIKEHREAYDIKFDEELKKFNQHGSVSDIQPPDFMQKS